MCSIRCCAHQMRERRRLVGRAVVAHDLVDLDAAFGEPCDGTFNEPDRGRSFLVCEDFDVREAGGVIDSRRARASQPARNVRRPGPRPAHTMPGTVEPAEFLDVEVHELAGMTTAITIRWFRRAQFPQPVQPETLTSTAHTVETAMSSVAAIFVLVQRNRRSRSIWRFDLRGCARRPPVRRRRPVQHRIARVVAGQPAIHGPLRTTRRVGGFFDRPALEADSFDTPAFVGTDSVGRYRAAASGSLR